MNIRDERTFWGVLAATRWFLAVAVMAGHDKIFLSDHSMLARILPPFGGKAAVIGFFLISGVSIAHSYQRSPDGYLARRFLRIYPLYFVAVSLAALVEWFSPPLLTLGGMTLPKLGAATYLGDFLLLQDFVVATTLYNGPLWSLSIEVFFYVLAPMFFLLRRQVLTVLILLSMLVYLL